jgi:ribosomal protein S27E
MDEHVFPCDINGTFLGLRVHVCGLHTYIFTSTALAVVCTFIGTGITQVESTHTHTHTRRTCRYTFVDLYRYGAVLQLAWTLLSLQPNTGNKVSNFLFRPRSSGVGVSPEMYYYSSAVSRVNVCAREREREPLLRKSIISRGRPRCVEIMQVPFLLGMPRAHSPPPD